MRHLSILPCYVRFLMGVLCLCWPCCQTAGQQFRIGTFRMLNNDITAYIEPVRDLNGEACALVKVVCEPAFAFSSPLGIVKRRNETGEIWLYLPHGTRFLTIKHPHWGVWRDYRFPEPLESRMTYELILSPPLKAPEGPAPLRNRPIAMDTTQHRANDRLSGRNTRPRHRPQERIHLLLLASVGTDFSTPSWGIRIAGMRRHGLYLSLQSDLHTLPSTQGKCDKEGIADGRQEAPFYTGNKRSARYRALAGGIHRIWQGLNLYEGIGYGEKRLAWETAQHQWLLNTGYSTKGVAAEIGSLYYHHQWAVSAGVVTIGTHHWELNVGIGLHF